MLRLALESPAGAAVISQGLRMGVNLLVVKMIAVFMGPSGMGFIGHFMSMATMVSVFAGGGIGNGITKYVAEYRERPRRMIRFIGAATVYGIAYSVVFLILSLTLNGVIARALFGDERYAWLIPMFGVAQVFCFIGTAIIAVANGLHLSRLFATISIVGYLAALPGIYLLIALFHIEGAALALMLVIACTGFPALWVAARSPLTRVVRLRIGKGDARQLACFSAMLVVSSTAFPLSEIAIRNHLIEFLGAESAGLWQALSRLSGAYLGFFNVFLATNFMPTLSRIPDSAIVVTEIRAMLIRIGLAFSLVACAIYLLRESVIRLLYSDAFSSMSLFLGWQLLGDLFRVLAYVIGFLAVAKAAILIYIGAEIVQAGLYGCLTYAVLSAGGGLTQVTQAYALTYFIYLCLAVIGLALYRRHSR